MRIMCYVPAEGCTCKNLITVVAVFYIKIIEKDAILIFGGGGGGSSAFFNFIFRTTN